MATDVSQAPVASQNSLLRFLTCGSVDDGKSTLIGRLLFDTKMIFDDQMTSLERDSTRFGTTGGDIDFALLVDGLEAEREQGITIDVAYRFFATDRRKFIVADTPGHEEYTRNMATGASTADLAVVLVDARQGILSQTRRHSFIASLLGIRHVILAVNKIDLADFNEAVFSAIVSDYLSFAQDLGLKSICPIPISARFGDNVCTRSARMPWYHGKTLIEELETVETASDLATRPFRFPVQLIARPDDSFRGLSGEIASGTIRTGEAVVMAKSGQASRVQRIVTMDDDLAAAEAGQAVTLMLEDEVDASRGDILSPPDNRPTVADHFQAKLIWFDANPLMPGRSYILRTENHSTNATVTTLKYQVNINTFSHEASKILQMNEIGVCNISTQAPIAFDPYSDNRITGNFILIDRMSNATVAAGMIDHPLRRALNVHWQSLSVDKKVRSELKAQRPAVLWFTGLSGAGKSTIANALEKMLTAEGRHTYMLDGDNLRHGLNRDLGFTAEDRVENIRRTAEVAKLMADAGLIVLVCLISPFRADRETARAMMPDGEFIEIFIDTPINVCAERDPKGLYKKAFAGQLANFTGVSSPYEAPDNPELRLDTTAEAPEDLAAQVAVFLAERQ
ncbi:sulfate adenylyltransferase subunit CysN [Affinirhizobium pseudoryzae]|uniref:sulfate adenylyltransferase subunit CysN n=1 Tax=Allorhizobium pseudoryzae TaxID=379684 RepID=UPI0013EAA9D9|nr:sulfate adenylyltransferase subunit CysN [Allorhizobium pseudoryzae]